jgi:hypothetical protein
MQNIMVLESLALKLLALGSHAASLFPHRRTVVKKTKIVVAVWQHIDPDSPPATQICTVKCQLYYCMCFVISWHFLWCLHCPYLFSHKDSSQICGHFCILYSLTWSIPASPEILQNLHFCAHISSCPWILYPYHCILNLILPFLCFLLSDLVSWPGFRFYSVTTSWKLYDLWMLNVKFIEHEFKRQTVH